MDRPDDPQSELAQSGLEQSTKQPGVTPVTPKRSSVQGAITLMVGTLFSRITGFLRQSLLNQLFTPEITDAFLVALRVPNLFRELLAEGALTNSFVPVYNKLPQAEAKRLAGALLGLLVLINSLLLVAAYAAAPYIVDLLLLGDGSVNRDLTLRLTRIVFPFLASISLSAWAMGILSAEERFFAPAWAPIALNVVAITLMLLYPNFAATLAWGFVLGGLAQFLVQLPVLIKGNFVHGFGKLWHPALATILLLIVPSVFTTSGRQVLNLVSANLLNTLPKGSVTAFSNAELFLSLALGLFSISPALSYYSRLSTYADAPEDFRQTLASGLRFITFLTVPAGLLLTVLATPVNRVVFDWLSILGRDGANEAVLLYSGLTLIPLGLAIFPIGLNNLLLRTFYIRAQVRTLIGITLTFLSLQGILYIVLSRYLGIEGLSWGTVIAAWLQFAVLLFLVARRESLELAPLLSYSLKVWLAASLAAGVCVLSLSFFPVITWWNALFALVGGGALFGLSYLLAALRLRLPELQQLLKRFRN